VICRSESLIEFGYAGPSLTAVEPGKPFSWGHKPAISQPHSAGAEIETSRDGGGDMERDVPLTIQLGGLGKQRELHLEK